MFHGVVFKGRLFHGLGWIDWVVTKKCWGLFGSVIGRRLTLTLTVPLYPDTPSRFKSRPQSRSEPEIDSISASSSFPYLHFHFHFQFHFHFHLLVAVSGPLLTYAIEPPPSLLLNFFNQLPLKPLMCPCFDLLCLCASSSSPFFFMLKRPYGYQDPAKSEYAGYTTPRIPQI